jgi:hypothetical protein
VDAVAGLLDSLFPGWESIGAVPENELSATLVQTIQSALACTYHQQVLWSKTWIRQAIAKATGRAAAWKADTAVIEKCSLEKPQAEAASLIARWSRLEEDLSKVNAFEQKQWPEVKEALKAIQNIKEGRYLELSLAEVLIEQVEEMLAFQVHEPQTTREAEPAELLEPAVYEPINNQLQVIASASTIPIPRRGSQSFAEWRNAMAVWGRQRELAGEAQNLMASSIKDQKWLEKARIFLELEGLVMQPDDSQHQRFQLDRVQKSSAMLQQEESEIASKARFQTTRIPDPDPSCLPMQESAISSKGSDPFQMDQEGSRSMQRWCLSVGDLGGYESTSPEPSRLFGALALLHPRKLSVGSLPDLLRHRLQPDVFASQSALNHSRPARRPHVVALRHGVEILQECALCLLPEPDTPAFFQ